MKEVLARKGKGSCWLRNGGTANGEDVFVLTNRERNRSIWEGHANNGERMVLRVRKKYLVNSSRKLEKGKEDNRRMVSGF